MSAERINLILEMLEIPDEPTMSSIGGLDGTDEMPLLSSLESDLSDLNVDMTDPNDDTTMMLGHVDRSSSPNFRFGESDREEEEDDGSVSPDSRKARE